MGKRELARLLGKLRAARAASDWHGMFTQEIREATKLHRLTNIANPLDDVISALQKELDKRDRGTKYKRNIQPREQRLPYKDD